jgi:NADP-dependent 3-hydroxy acid dehydrogenase YdfG
MKTILITGASSGIGRATAEMFLAEGWQVGLLARRAEALEEVAK